MRFLLLILMCVLATGCGASPRCRRETALLRAEIRDLEDKYLLLKSEHESVVGGFETVTEEIIIEPTTTSPIIYDDFDTAPAAPSILEHNTQPTTQPSVSPNIEVLPEPEDASISLGPLDDAVFSPDARRVEIRNVAINRNASHGQNLDSEPGDEGLELFIQPLQADGSVALQTGELTVSVLDPSETPQRQRIGLWKFLPTETELFFANDPREGTGILLHLPWDQTAPTREQLTVHVRFVTPEGQTLKTSMRMRITPPALGYSPTDPIVAAWAQRDPRWMPESDLQTSATWRRAQGQTASRPSRQPSSNSGRSRIRAIPAKAAIRKPSWRPVR